MRLNVPVRQLRPALAVMADVALRPTFPAAELERLRQERLTALLQAKDDAASVAPLAFARVVFGPTHRYGTAGERHRARTLKAMTAAQMRAFHAARYQPSNATLIVVGDVTATGVLPLLEEAFGDWPMAAPVASDARCRSAPQLTAGQVTIVDMPSAAAVADPHRLGRRAALDARLLPARRAQHDPGRLVHVAPQPEPARRARLLLRRQLALRHAAVGGRVPGRRRRAERQDRPRRCAEFFKELKGIREPVGEAELAKAKNYVALSFPSEFETIGDLTPADFLQLLAEGEMLAQDIIARIDLSQSSISRHLKMLVSTGLVLERRAEGANKRYRLDPTRVEWIWTALRRLLAGQPGQPKRRYATSRRWSCAGFWTPRDAWLSGPLASAIVIWCLTTWPRISRAGATPTERGREYEEREINHILSRWDRSLDPATLRRILFETRRLARTTDGRSYWVPEA